MRGGLSVDAGSLVLALGDCWQLQKVVFCKGWVDVFAIWYSCECEVLSFGSLSRFAGV